MLSGKICSLRAFCTLMALALVNGQIYYAPRVLAPASYYSYYRPFPSVLAPALPVAAAPAVPVGPPVPAPVAPVLAAAPAVVAAAPAVVPAAFAAPAFYGYGANKGAKSFSSMKGALTNSH